MIQSDSPEELVTFVIGIEMVRSGNVDLEKHWILNQAKGMTKPLRHRTHLRSRKLR